MPPRRFFSHRKAQAMRPWLLLALVLAAAVGALSWLGAGSWLRAQANLRSGNASLKSDFGLPDAPHFGVEAGAIEECSEPSGSAPASSPSPRPVGVSPDTGGRVAGERLAHQAWQEPGGVEVVCRSDAAHLPPPRKYVADVKQFSDFPARPFDMAAKPLPDGGIIYESRINGRNWREVIERACGAAIHWECGRETAHACALAKIGEIPIERLRARSLYDVFYLLSRPLTFLARIAVLFDELPWGDFELSSGLIVDAAHRGVWHVREPVYTAAHEDSDKVPVWYALALWSLSNRDQQLLRQKNPWLLTLAQAGLDNTRRHEMAHYSIFQRFLPQYMEVINQPEAQAQKLPRLVRSTNEYVNESSGLPLLLKQEWDRVLEEEGKEHSRFHVNEAASQYGYTALIYWKGVGFINCNYGAVQDFLNYNNLPVEIKYYNIVNRYS